MADAVKIVKHVTVLKLKVTAADGLDDLAKDCRRARNVAAENWLLRQRGLPLQPAQTAAAERARDARGKDLCEAQYLYHAMREALPDLGTSLVGALSVGITEYLGAKQDWRRGLTEDGKRLKRKDAILAHEDRPPFFTSLEVPVKSKVARVVMGDECTLMLSNTRAGCCPALAITLSLRKMPEGYVKILRELATGSRKLADSRLVQKRGEWFWHIPVVSEHVLCGDKVATLWPVTECGEKQRNTYRDRPFRLVRPSGERHLGPGDWLRHNIARLIGLRKAIGARYRYGNGAGHGRQKIDEAVRKRVRQAENMRREARKLIIADVWKLAQYEGCGTVLYREPTGPAKDKCWFAANGIDWDWTGFGADLANACAARGIEVVVEKLKIKEVIASGGSVESRVCEVLPPATPALRPLVAVGV